MPWVADIAAVRMGYGDRGGFANRSDPTLRWAWWLDLDQSAGEVARRYSWLAEENGELEGQIRRLVRETAPGLVALEGVGPDTAATLLIVVGDNPEQTSP